MPWHTKPYTCPTCKRPMTKADLKKRYEDSTKRKSQALKSTYKMKRELGEHIGRPKIRDDEKIHSLRLAGMSIRNIAKELGISTATVCAGLNNPAPRNVVGEK